MCLYTHTIRKCVLNGVNNAAHAQITSGELSVLLTRTKLNCPVLLKIFSYHQCEKNVKNNGKESILFNW